MSDAKALIKHGAERAAERYADNIPLRAAVALIPVLGAPIDVAFTTFAGRIQAARIGALIEDLQQEARKLRDETISKTFLESEEWLDTVLAAFEAASRTRDREQIRAYARILVGAASPESHEMPEPRALLSVLSELTPIELALASLIADMVGSIRYDELRQARRVVTKEAWDGVLASAPEASKPNLLFHLKRLERAGLISELTGAYGGSGGRYEPTPTLWRIRRYLREEAAAASSPEGTT